MTGDASAAIALTALPGPTQRLAEMLVQQFSAKAGRKPRPPKKSKPKDNASSRRELTVAMQMLAADLASPDPWVREQAREALSV